MHRSKGKSDYKYGRFTFFLDGHKGWRTLPSWMQELKKRTCFHKLSYRLDEKVKSKGTFYDVVIRGAVS